MGYDIHGTTPTAPEGTRFRRSNLAWPPLAALCQELGPDIAERCATWTSNDGDGLDGSHQPRSAALGIAKQSPETLLLKMPIIGKNFSEAFLAHRLH